MRFRFFSRREPAGIASDLQRRVLGHLPLPRDEQTSLEALAERIAPDFFTPLGPDDLGLILNVLLDLEKVGHISLDRGGWKMTKQGLKALKAPVKE